MSMFDRRSPQKSDQDRLWNLLGDHSTFMLTTSSPTGKSDALRARPMAGYPYSQEQRIWFLAHKDGLTDDEIAADPHVCVTLSDPSKQRFVAINGKASVKHDMARKRDLWSIAAQAWFPDGPADPDIILLCVDVESGEFWDGEANPTLVSFKVARAAAQGRQANLGQNDKVSFERQRTAKPDTFSFSSHH